MKLFNPIVLLLIIVFALTVSFMPVSAADDKAENYTLAIENTYTEPSYNESIVTGGIFLFSDVKFDGCFGNQLSGTAKELYDSFVDYYAIEKKTGMYVYTFKNPFTFNVKITGGTIDMNDELSAVISELKYSVQEAMDAFLYDHPEVFWIKLIGSSYSISASWDPVNGYTGHIDTIIIKPTEIYRGASKKVSKYSLAVESALESIVTTGSRYETLKNIHDYICNKAWYNLKEVNSVHTSEPFFLGDGGVVCEGYAKSFKVLCDRLNIPCVLVNGDAGESHMWNYVQMENGEWYLVDITWDDQDSGIYYTYFLADAGTVGFKNLAVSKERTEKNDFSGTGIFRFVYPVLSTTPYADHTHKWNKYYTSDVEPTCTRKGSMSIHCSLCAEKKNVTEIPATGHKNITTYPKVKPTCTKTGLTEGKTCKDCGAVILARKTVAKKAHTYNAITTKATLSKDGKIINKCSVCGSSKTKIIYCPTKITLSTTGYTYDGKTKSPSVIVKDSKGNSLKKGTDYTVKYAGGRKSIGRYAVTITFKGKYTGTKKLYFTIVPKATNKITASQTTTTITLKWNKVTGADGYRVYKYNLKTKKYEKLKDVTGTVLKISKLKSGTVCNYKIRAYSKGNETIWGDYSKAFETATKPATPKIKKLTTSKGKVSFSWSDVSGESGYEVYYSLNKDSGYKIVASYKPDVVKGSKSKLTSGKTYYFRVRAYKKTASGTVYSDWSSAKSIKV